MSIFPTFKSNRSYAPDDDYWYNPVGFTSGAGVKVSEKTALKYLTVTACVKLIASDIAKLPLNLYRKRKDGGKDLVTDHKLYDILHNAPNNETTSFNWRESQQGHALLWGNSYSFIDREKISGAVKALWQISDPSKVTVDRRKSDGQIIYTFTNSDGKEKTYTRDKIFHIPGFGFNGLMGHVKYCTCKRSNRPGHIC